MVIYFSLNYMIKWAPMEPRRKGFLGVVDARWVGAGPVREAGKTQEIETEEYDLKL